MRLHLLTLSLLLVAMPRGLAERETPTFSHDVMAVLSKAGCSNGGCHGNARGRGSLRLSLWGEFPDQDYSALTQSKASRLLMRDAPEKSLLLRKPTLQLGHEGGERFKMGSPEYETLLRWIQDGAPADPSGTPILESLEVVPRDSVIIGPKREIRLRVTAHFSNGASRDVSRWAVYEPSELICDISPNGQVTAHRDGETTINVRYLDKQVSVPLAFVPARAEFEWRAPAPAHDLDEAVQRKLRRLRMTPSPPCDDATFLRRTSLDLTGLLPEAQEARNFVSEKDPNKRARLLDRLLASPAFADQWALKWSDLLRNEEKALDEKGVERFYGWIRDSMAEGKPLDQFTRELVSATGSTYENPPANYYRSLRDPTLRAEATAQLFLGTRLQCARCHRHPYERWTQDDYYQFSAIFDGLDYKIIKNERRDKLDKNQFIGEQIVQVGLERKLKDPRSGEQPSTAFLPLSGVQQPQHGHDLTSLGEWLTSPANPLFAKVQANRIWFQIFGKGIVDPVDDFRSTNPPINPELLELVERELVIGGFDLRRLIRWIAESNTYQASSEPTLTNADDARNFSHTLVSRLSAEVLLDAMHQVLGTRPHFTDIDQPLRAAQLPGVEKIHRNRRPKTDEHFLKLFGRPVRQLNSDLERSNATSLAQVFEMTSGRTLHGILIDPNNRLSRWVSEDHSTETLVDHLYWSALTRPPSENEAQQAQAHLESAPHLRPALEDLTWAVLNSKEFLLRR